MDVLPEEGTSFARVCKCRLGEYKREPTMSGVRVDSEVLIVVLCY